MPIPRSAPRAADDAGPLGARGRGGGGLASRRGGVRRGLVGRARLVDRARQGHGGRPDARDRRAHRRDRPRDHARRRQGLPLVPRHRRLAARGAALAARRGADARRRASRRDRQEAQLVQEGQGREDRAEGPVHRHRRARRRRGALGRPARRRRRARVRSRSSCATTASPRARATTASAATSRSRRRDASRRQAAHRATSSRSRRSARRSATSPARARRRTAFGPDVAIAVDVTWTRATSPRPRSRRWATSASAQGAVARARRAAERRTLRPARRDREAGGDPVHGIEVVRGSTHTDADAYHLSRAGIATEPRLGPDALHPHADGARVARRRRERRQAARRVRAAARARSS